MLIEFYSKLATFIHGERLCTWIVVSGKFYDRVETSMGIVITNRIWNQKSYVDLCGSLFYQVCPTVRSSVCLSSNFNFAFFNWSPTSYDWFGHSLDQAFSCDMGADHLVTLILNLWPLDIIEISWWLILLQVDTHTDLTGFPPSADTPWLGQLCKWPCIYG